MAPKDDPLLTRVAKLAARRVAEEAGEQPFRDGVAAYIFVLDQKGNLSIAVVGKPTLAQTEYLVRGAERVRAERSS